MKTVSIITVTQYSRRKCLANLQTLIESQTMFDSIIEWVIVEGSPNNIDVMKNKEIIQKIFFDHPIKYIEVPEIRAISNLRNAGNYHCSGDIIVCMDDDDYYFPTYIAECVLKLEYSGKQIAGCTNPFMFCYRSNTLYKIKGFSPNHSTNNCMAYTQKYLENHSHHPNLFYAEETSFTNGFTEDMVQLDPSKTIIVSCHYANTVNKTEFCKSNNLYEIKHSIGLDKIIEKMRSILK